MINPGDSMEIILHNTEFWITAERKRYAVVHMDNRHLVNTINYLRRRFNSALISLMSTPLLLAMVREAERRDIHHYII